MKNHKKKIGMLALYSLLSHGTYRVFRNMICQVAEAWSCSNGLY
jgi:hypothetical protein